MHVKILASILLFGALGTNAAGTEPTPADAADQCDKREYSSTHTGSGYLYDPFPTKGDHGPGTPETVTGNCGDIHEPYNRNAAVACVTPGWKELCGKGVTVWNRKTEAYMKVLVADLCPEVACNDILLTESVFLKIGGNITSGVVDEGVAWYDDSDYVH
ncbi:unnamed protein product [Tilletia controversa]|uniref:Uncharacterized protein n=3 Tax=Tilletia TaxID=13289 RepID=A0A8X7SVV6_9BASI|nr:hypothetical protein CF336_g4535 [Tilletia laevis]KAE8194010.1 hypothetical protein CF328_g4884 [Tilletia controversa]KAE8257958.1 hypothetical protein A4X03_0g4520 [Tilletia caries]KAE8197653.1 hypothetical protein CF335_g4563 [Tilletia laevis]KAE8245296.1 hypothetical protein A4X06_0g5748 [Tilletia controversa]